MSAPHPLTALGVAGGLAGFVVGEPSIAVFGLGLAACQILIEGFEMKHRVDVDCRPVSPCGPPGRRPTPPPPAFDEAEIWRAPPAPPAAPPVARGVLAYAVGAISGALATALLLLAWRVFA